MPRKPRKTTTTATHPTIADLEALAAVHAPQQPELQQQPLFDDTGVQSAVGTMRKKPTKRGFRGQFKFWLDAGKSDELALGQELNALKSKRQYTPTIRNALRLFFDLRAGRVDVLLELFPWIRDVLATPQPASASTDFNILLNEIAALKATLSTAPVAAAPAPVRFTEPRRNADDTQLVTVTSGGGKATGQQVASNFLSSMGSFFD